MEQLFWAWAEAHRIHHHILIQSGSHETGSVSEFPLSKIEVGYKQYKHLNLEGYRGQKIEVFQNCFYQLDTLWEFLNAEETFPLILLSWTILCLGYLSQLLTVPSATQHLISPAGLLYPKILLTTCSTDLALGTEACWSDFWGPVSCTSKISDFEDLRKLLPKIAAGVSAGITISQVKVDA